MNREEAKELLTHVMISYVPKDQYGDLDDPEPYDQAFDMAIEALSAGAESDDLIIKGAKGIKDGLYNIKDGELFQYKSNGGSVRAYSIIPSAETSTASANTPTCLINREDAIHLLVEKYKFTTKEATEILSEIQYVEWSKWIPCCEQLPNEDGRYLVTYPLMSGKNWISIKWFGKPGFPNRAIKGKCFYESDSEYGDVIWDDVIAWMPLPQNYQEERYEQNERFNKNCEQK